MLLAACGNGGGESRGNVTIPDAFFHDATLPDMSDAANDATPDARTYTDDELEAAAGIFRANCSTCHGPELGNGAESWVTGMGTRALAGIPSPIIAVMVRAGQPPHMPAFHENEISDEQMGALGAYIESLPDGTREPPSHDFEVAMRDHDPWFFPMQLRIEVGQTVRFVNEGATYHDTSQFEWVETGGQEGFGSGQMGPGGTFYRRFDKAGVVTVMCKDHPYMRGEIHVGQEPKAPAWKPSEPQPLPSRAGVGEIWVAAQWQDRDDGSGDGVLHVIDASSWTEVAQLPAHNNPHNLWGIDDGARIVVTNWFDNTLTIVDAVAREIVDEKTVGATPAHVMAPPDSSIVWVTIEGSHYVEALDPASWWFARDGRIMLSGNMPHGLGFGGGRLLVANSMTDDASVVDVATGVETAVIPTGTYPLGATVTSDGAIGFIGNCLANTTLSILDLEAGEKTDDVALDGCVEQIAVTDDGSRVVVAHGNMTAVIEVATRTVIADLPTGLGAHGVAIGPAEDAGTFAYVTHKYDNHIAVIDVNSAEHLGDVPLSVGETGHSALVGVTDTGGQGIFARVP